MFTECFVYLATPIIAGLIGWGTNYLAVKMIFRPHQPHKFFGITYQGLIPRRQKELAENIAQTIEEKLLSHKDIQEALRNADIQAEIETLVRAQIQLFLTEKLGGQPFVGLLLHDKIREGVAELLISQFREMIPLFIDDLMLKVEEKISFRNIMQRKIESFAMQTLEDIIYKIASRELKAIELLGGVLGLVVGLVQLAVFIYAG